MERLTQMPASKIANVSTGDISAALEQVATRLELWREQRAEIAAEVRQIIDRAEGILRELGQPGLPNVGGRQPSKAPVATRARQGSLVRRRSRHSPRRSGKGRMSKAARARIAAAQRKRWAAWREQAGK
jgi:hypothetical protein